ncbi:glycoside hydrolase family 13 protein [Bacillus atrophaeus]|uniref:Alpha-amylase n=1 Tax=Bacillus atrophaeus (strain 1942) TaxID=720555 RepID=A0ABN3ZFK6_BACA1|nr:alpha-glucosidase [Bacillus atrophaeus]AMR61649.1 glucohydrolase [Bacillus subtilis subsp. globigii]ADP33618.1 putative oligo-1,6-glucosidase [Bacillus atrophaeus 1942]AIK47236.1 alpha-glucosidase [Bacillus atrophaeus subsp. globigii]EIM10591.1 putative oligo-1,6-glucosidase [Bacillus atrophaeus C89]KFK82896.1 alpha-glucosidase [Bacillus atrophaeus]
MEKAWWKEAVVYQIYPRSFKDSNGDGIGDINGIRSMLPYIKDLGADVIWICPVFDSPNADNGYDIRDYKKILTEFGTMDDLDSLLNEIHELGMKLIIDLVVNHTSDEHPWFIESRSALDSEKRDWYIWKDGKNGKEPNNWESIFSGSAWQYDQTTDQYYLHLFDKKQPDLNWENQNMRFAVYEMVNWWLDKGIDGFRVDAISHIKKKKGLPDLPNPEALPYVPSFPYHMNVEGIMDFLRELKKETFSRYPIVTVGEANGVTADEAADWAGGKSGIFDMIFQFEHLGLWDIDADERIDVAELKRILSKWQNSLEGVGWNALFMENHDQPRSVSAWGDDQTYVTESAKALAAMYFLMKGTPFIYQGQEIGMTNVAFPSIEDYDDVAMKRLYDIETAKGVPHKEMMKVIWKKGRDNSRTPMQWNESKYAGFSDAPPWIGINDNYTWLNAKSQMQDKASVYHFYKNLIALRRKYDVFIYGLYDLLLPEDKQIFAYLRKSDRQTALILTNLTKTPALYRHPAYPLSSDSLVLSNIETTHHQHTTSILLQPYETRIYVW